MANKDKKKTGGAGAKKGGGEKAPVEKADASEKAVEAKPVQREEHDEAKHDDHGAPAAAHGANAHAAHAPNRREYWMIFVVLFVLTVLEVGVAQVPGIGRGLMTSALILLALTKAACVGLFYMHLKHETKILKMTVFLPFAMPALYAFVLIGDAAWRLVRW